MPTKRRPTDVAAPARMPVSSETAKRATLAIRNLLKELEAGDEPVTHTLLQKLLKDQGIPASSRTYYAIVAAGSAIALDIGRAQARQRQLSQGTPLARARQEAKQLRERIAELEEANRMLLAQQAAMIAYLTNDMTGPGLDVTVIQRAQRASLGDVVRGTAFARRPLASSSRPHGGRGGSHR